MLSHNPTAQYSAYPYKPSLSEAAAWLVAQRTKEERANRHWICTSCGTTHTAILLEECKGCGTTALEFKYSTTHIAH